MFGIATESGRFTGRTARRRSVWSRHPLCEVVLAGLGCAVIGASMAAQLRSGSDGTPTYLALPGLWLVALWLAGAHKLELSRGYVAMALASVILFDLLARFGMRKRLHQQLAAGQRWHSVVAVPDEAKNYPERGRRRLMVKPGLTGLWQASGQCVQSWSFALRPAGHVEGLLSAGSWVRRVATDFRR